MTFLKLTECNSILVYSTKLVRIGQRKLITSMAPRKFTFNWAGKDVTKMSFFN